MSLSTVKGTVTPFKLTAFAKVKPVPLKVTTVCTGPEVGVKVASVGAGITVKFPVLVAVPAAVVTLIGPLVAPVGTVAVICVSLSTAKLDAATPLKMTAVAPVKSQPFRVTVLPTGPEAVVKPVMSAGVPGSGAVKNGVNEM